MVDAHSNVRERDCTHVIVFTHKARKAVSHPKVLEPKVFQPTQGIVGTKVFFNTFGYSSAEWYGGGAAQFAFKCDRGTHHHTDHTDHTPARWRDPHRICHTSHHSGRFIYKERRNVRLTTNHQAWRTRKYHATKQKGTARTHARTHAHATRTL